MGAMALALDGAEDEMNLQEEPMLQPPAPAQNGASSSFEALRGGEPATGSGGTVQISLDGSGILHKGASIYYVRKIFGIMDPLPPLFAWWAES